MKLSTLMRINAVVAAVFGIPFVLVPGQLISIYGPTPDEPMKSLGRLFGAALIAFAVLTWSARSASDSEALRSIALALFVGDSLGFIASLIGQMSGVFNALGWSTVGIYLLVASGFGYFQFSRPPSLQVTEPG